MLRAVNYDNAQHHKYKSGRELRPDTLDQWAHAFEKWAPDKRPLTCLDLGSGTGRFTPLLGNLFGGPATELSPPPKCGRSPKPTPTLHRSLIGREALNTFPCQTARATSY